MNSSTKTAILVAVLLIIAALAFYCRSAFVAATVNGSPISRYEVMKEAEKQDGKTVLDNIITKKIIRDAAMKQKIVVTDTEIAAEITKLETQMKAQNTTLDAALTQQGMTRDSLREQIILQKLVEKMVPKSAPITDEAVAAYIKTNSIAIPSGQEATYKTEIAAQMAQEAFSQAAQKLITEIKAKATINYLIKY